MSSFREKRWTLTLKVELDLPLDTPIPEVEDIAEQITDQVEQELEDFGTTRRTDLKIENTPHMEPRL